MSSVTVPKSLVVAGGVVIVALVAAVAFLAGRESARDPRSSAREEGLGARERPLGEESLGARDREAPSGLEEIARAARPSPRSPSPSPSDDLEGRERVIDGERTLPGERALGAERTPTSERLKETEARTRADERGGGAPSEPSDRPPLPAPSPRSSDEAAVRAYLAKVDQIQSEASGGASPRAFAEKLVAEALSGDGSGFVELVRSIGDAEAKVRAITPPEPARAHHAAMLAALAESKALIVRLERAIAAKDADALASISSASTELQHKTDALQRAEADLRARYGIEASGH